MSVKVLIDSRERRSGVIDLLQAGGEIEVEVRQLTLGDYEVGGEILFERKTAVDFGASLLEGRLFSQAYRLAGGSRRPAYLLEWEGGFGEIKGVSQASIDGAMVTLALMFGIPILWSGSPEGSARIIRYTARQLERLRGDREWVVFGRKARRNRTIRSRMLQSVPGIGPKSAGLLLSHFGTISALCQAGPSEWSAIPGIRATVAEKLYQVVHSGQA